MKNKKYTYKKTENYLLNIFNMLKRDLYIILNDPREYVYSFVSSPVKKIKLYQYDPKSQILFKRIKKKIIKNFPELDVHLYGSSDLKILGEKDVDIFVISKSRDVSKYISKLNKLFGKSAKIKDEYVEWVFSKDSFIVELTLVYSGNKLYKKQIERYEALKRNPVFIKQYETLKSISNGLPIREYHKNKLHFLISLSKI